MIRDLTIGAVLNGYVVTVGCQTVVFNSRPDMLKELDLYLDKPEEREAHYRKHALNGGKCLGVPAPAPANCDTATNTVGITYRNAVEPASEPATRPIR